MIQSVLSFVLFTRSVVMFVVQTWLLPFKVIAQYLPIEGDDSPSRIGRWKAWVHEWTVPNFPAWAEYRGDYSILLKTTKGQDYVDALVDRIPEPIYQRWHRFSMGMMLFWLTVWCVFLLGLIGTILAISGIEAVQFLLHPSFEWLLVDPTVGDTETTLSAGELFFGLVNLVAAILLFYVLYCAIFIAFLPGIAFHEFGHYAAATRANVEVTGYGLLFKGPVPMGAFVHIPDAELDDAPPTDEMRILAAGVGNSTIMAVLWLILAAVLVLTGSVSVGSYSIETLAYVAILMLGLTELCNAFANAMPAGPVDGGLFMQAAEERVNET